MLRYVLSFGLTFGLCLAAFAQTPSSPSGKWVSNLKFFEDNNYDRMELSLNGTKLTGKLGGGDFDGSFEGGRIEATVKWSSQYSVRLTGNLQGDRIAGKGIFGRGER